MNQEQAKAWLPLIQAVAEGKTLQLKHRSLNANTGMRDSPRFKWKDYNGLFSDLFVDAADKFRIKPEPKKQWYRVAKMRGNLFYTTTADNDRDERNMEGHPYFVQ